MYEQSLAIAERLVQDHPDVINYRWAVEGSHQVIGWTRYRLCGRIEDARVWYTKALDLAEAIARDNPDLETARAAVAGCNHELGRVLVLLGKPEEALATTKKALKYCEGRERKNADGVWERRELGYLYYEIGQIDLAAGREPPQASSWFDRAGLSWNPSLSRAPLRPFNRAALRALHDLVGPRQTDLGPENQTRRARSPSELWHLCTKPSQAGIRTPK